MFNKIIDIGKTLLSITIMLMLFLILDRLFDSKVAMNFLAVELLIMAVLFSFKNEFYVKYSNFVNPLCMKKLEQKGEVFKKEDIKIHIICQYFISFMIFFNAYMQPANTHFFTMDSYKSVLPFCLIIGVFIIFSAIIDSFIMKNSNSYNSYFAYSTLFGLIVCIIFIFLIGSVVLHSNVFNRFIIYR